MQTKEVLLPGWDSPVLVHHANDWTGNVSIQWTDECEQFHSVELPARLLLALSINEAKQFVLDELTLALYRLGKGHHVNEG